MQLTRYKQAKQQQKPYPTAIVVSFLVLAFIFSICMPLAVQAQDKEKKKEIYNPALDVKSAITNSLTQAKKENKHVILMFGGNWCPWCHRLHQLFKSDPTIKQFLADNYLLIMVDVGEKPNEPLNRDLVTRYGVNGMGYPCLSVLAPGGELLCSQSTGVLEKDKGHDPERVLAFLKAEAPAKK